MSKVLVVDDEATRGGTIRQALERGGFETASAGDGNEALRTFLTEVPDIVMVGPLAADPDEGFCRRMRETRPGLSTPIILFGEALRGDALKVALQRSGCDAYVEVPASAERLIEVCRQALGEVSGTGGAVAAPRPAAFAAGAPGTEGRDIEEHLESMFETGAPPARSAYTEPEVSFDTDLAPRRPDEVGAPRASLADGIGGPAGAEVDPTELLGFEPDVVTFGEGATVDPRRDADAAADTLPPARRAEAAVARHAPPPAVVPDSHPSPVESLDFALDEPAPASRAAEPPRALPPEIAARPASRTWMWGVGAAVLLGGAAGLFFMLRPSAGTGAAEPTRVAGALPAAVEPAPRPDAPVARIGARPGVSETAEPPAGDPGLDAAAAASADTGTASGDDGTAHDPGEPADVADATEVSEAGEAMIAADAGNPGPDVARVDPPPATTRPAPPQAREPAVTAPPAPQAQQPTAAAEPPASTPQRQPQQDTRPTPPAPPAPAVATPPARPAPKPNRETVFVPSLEAMDVDTAGPGFTAPQAINLVAPQYASAAVQPGGENVVLKVLVNDWGKVVRVVVEQGHAGSPLVEASINAVLETRYRPARYKNQDVRAWTRETFVFR